MISVSRQLSDIASRRIGIEGMYAILKDAIQDRRPFAMIRLGDAEGAILAHPYPTDWEEAYGIMQVYPQDFTPADLLVIRDLVISAIGSADLIGLPSATQCSKHVRFTRVLQTCIDRRLISHRQGIVDHNTHWYLQLSGAYGALLKNLPFLGLVGCRDIAAQVGEELSIGHVECHLIRGERQLEGSTELKHWPDGFIDTINNIKPPYPGAVYLVGAGAWGTYYCKIIKERGGIAVDIGSIMDSWAGLGARMRYTRWPEFFDLKGLANIADESFRDGTAKAITAERCKVIELEGAHI